MTYDLREFSYLWDGSVRGWVLLRAPDLAGGYCVFNEAHSTLLHIEDEELNEALCQQMKAAGCRSIDEIPKNVTPRVEPNG
jgi:hypothetical protein